jgi:pilus assembly protein CpaE
MGGLDAALDRYATETAPDLIIAESTLGAEALLEKTAGLSSLASSAKLMVIGCVNDVFLYRELLRRSVNDYLAAPFSLTELIDSVSVLFDDPSGRPLGQVIAFVGARGGAGSSTVCHNVAWAIAGGFSGDTVIADFDLSFGTTGLDFNQNPGNGLAEALAMGDRLNEQRLDRLLTNCADNLSLLAGPASLDCENGLEEGAAERVIETLRQTRPYVALDIPHQWSESVRQIILMADDIVVTAEPDLASLRNAKLLLDQFKSWRNGDRPPLLALNKAHTPNRPEIGVAEFANALGVEPAAVFGFDAHLFGAAANNGLMIEEAARRSEAAASFRALAGALIGAAQLKPAPQGIFGQILNRLPFSRAAQF